MAQTSMEWIPLVLASNTDESGQSIKTTKNQVIVSLTIEEWKVCCPGFDCTGEERRGREGGEGGEKRSEEGEGRGVKRGREEGEGEKRGREEGEGEGRGRRGRKEE